MTLWRRKSVGTKLGTALRAGLTALCSQPMGLKDNNMLASVAHRLRKQPSAASRDWKRIPCSIFPIVDFINSCMIKC